MTDEIDVLRAFVRGESEWQMLHTIGVSVEFDAECLKVEEPARAPTYEPTADDVAAGLLAHWAIGTTLRDWASVLLATGMIDLSSLEDHSDGEALLNALWDAAEGSEPTQQALDAARRVATSL